MLFRLPLSFIVASFLICKYSRASTIIVLACISVPQSLWPSVCVCMFVCRNYDNKRLEDVQGHKVGIGYVVTNSFVLRRTIENNLPVKIFG